MVRCLPSGHGAKGHYAAGLDDEYAECLALVFWEGGSELSGFWLSGVRVYGLCPEVLIVLRV